MSHTPQWALYEIRKTQEQGLKKLELSEYGEGIKITSFPLEVLEMTELEELVIVGSFGDIPNDIVKLQNLKVLYLSGKQISIPDELAKLSQLRRLSLAGQYVSIPDWTPEFRGLKELILNGQYSNIPAWLANLSQLTELHLYGRFESIPQSLYELRQLEVLMLSSKKLKTISPELIKLEKLKTFNLSLHALESPPPEIIYQGLEAIREYFLALQAEENDYIYEAKLLILGEGGAGKTTLARKLQDENAEMPPPSATTEGVEIHHWYFPTQDGKQFRVNIWDFGGQEIYHATHQYFLTSRSLYALVADNRKEDTDFNYWLNVIELLSDNSPLLIVNNEKENRQREINENQLKGRFGNIQEILSVNLQSNRRLDTLRKGICYQLEKLPHVGTSLPKSWVDIRHALEEDPRNYILYNDYLQLCENFNIKEESRAEVIIGYLHDLGVCLHFKKDPILSQYVILKPHWGTSAAYAVLDNTIVINNMGRFNLKDLQAIWTDSAYKGMHRALLQLMLNFKLCYQIPNTEHYIAPQLLSRNQKDYAWNERENLFLRYHYEFMPKGIILRFIVAMHREIEADLVWRTGLVLHHERARAEVMEDYTGSKILIRVSGRDKQELRGIISREFDEIHATYKGLRYKKLIPCICSDCSQSTEPYFFPYEAVKRADDKNRSIQCQVSFEDVEPRELLRDISETPKTDKDFEEIEFGSIKQKPDIFLSYARANADIMHEVKAAMEKQGLVVWADLERIEADTASWKNKIEDGLDSASCLVLLASPAAKKSEWVGHELDYALAHKKPIFVFLVDGDTATALKFGYTAHQYIDLQKKPDEGVRKMIQEIKEKLGIK
jgi:internalin A